MNRIINYIGQIINRRSNRILTVESIEDSTTRKLLKEIYGSKNFDKFKIEHFYFVSHNEKSITGELLYTRFNDIIKSFKPHVILIHSGAYFFKSKEIFYHTIIKLKKEYPKIQFGIQNRQNINERFIAVLNNTRKIKNLEELFFKIDR